MNATTSPPPIPQEHALLVQNELLEAMNQQLGEGITWQAIAGGAGSALTHFLVARIGAAAAIVWLTKHAAMVYAMFGGSHGRK